MTKTQEDFFNNYIYPSLYCKGSERVTQGLHVRGSWRPNITEIFWPQSYGRQCCVFSFSSGPQFNQGSREPLRPGVTFPTTSPLQLALELNYPLLFNSLALYYLQTPTWWYGHASTPPQFLPISGDQDVSLPLSLE